MHEHNSILLVDRRYEPGQTSQTAQLDASHANAVPVAVQVATMNIDESGLWSTKITCSGTSQPAARKGKSALRKPLRGGDGTASGEWEDSGRD